MGRSYRDPSSAESCGPHPGLGVSFVSRVVVDDAVGGAGSWDTGCAGFTSLAILASSTASWLMIT